MKYRYGNPKRNDGYTQVLPVRLTSMISSNRELVRGRTAARRTEARATTSSQK